MILSCWILKNSLSMSCSLIAHFLNNKKNHQSELNYLMNQSLIKECYPSLCCSKLDHIVFLLTYLLRKIWCVTDTIGLPMTEKDRKIDRCETPILLIGVVFLFVHKNNWLDLYFVPQTLCLRFKSQGCCYCVLGYFSYPTFLLGRCQPHSKVQLVSLG